MGKTGFTLVELVIAMGIMLVVMAMGFVAVQASNRSAMTAQARATVQQNVRDVMAEMARELELAATVTTPPDVYALSVSSNPAEVVFQVPADLTGNNWSTPITYRFVNEDQNANGKLDDFEDDEDEDGVLTRRVIRLQDWAQRPLGAANDLENVDFTLDATGRMLKVTLSASKGVGMGNDYDAARTALSSQIRLLN